jgi:hypothetical protein
LAFEFPIAGDFTADLAVRDKVHNALVFIEFEDAKRDSLFKNVGRFHTEWGKRLEHGTGQIIDWLWKLADLEHTKDFESKIGRNAQYQTLLVVGRSKYLSTQDRERLIWRTSKTVINSHYIKCLTYDDLYQMCYNKSKWL